MGICCSRAAAGELDEDDGFPWKHDDLFHELLWNSARVSMHTKQGWKGANQDAMTVSQVTSLLFSPPLSPSAAWIDLVDRSIRENCAVLLHCFFLVFTRMHWKVSPPENSATENAPTFFSACMYLVRNPPL
jgi:hypothetical protein